jgi:hypothetical protein
MSISNKYSVTTSGWEGKEPASAGFLLAAIWASYVQNKINKSYQLDTTMKINEIAINENKYDTILGTGKVAGKGLPRVQRLPGETTKDAITRTRAELGGS